MKCIGSAEILTSLQSSPCLCWGRVLLCPNDLHNVHLQFANSKVIFLHLVGWNSEASSTGWSLEIPWKPTRGCDLDKPHIISKTKIAIKTVNSICKNKRARMGSPFLWLRYSSASKVVWSFILVWLRRKFFPHHLHLSGLISGAFFINNEQKFSHKNGSKFIDPYLCRVEPPESSTNKSPSKSWFCICRSCANWSWKTDKCGKKRNDKWETSSRNLGGEEEEQQQQEEKEKEEKKKSKEKTRRSFSSWVFTA